MKSNKILFVPCALIAVTAVLWIAYQRSKLSFLESRYYAFALDSLRLRAGLTNISDTATLVRFVEQRSTGPEVEPTEWLVSSSAPIDFEGEGIDRAALILSEDDVREMVSLILKDRGRDLTNAKPRIWKVNNRRFVGATFVLDGVYYLYVRRDPSAGG